MIFLSLLFIIIVNWVLDLKFWRTTLKINPSFLARTVEAEEEKKEASAVPETAEGFHRAPEIKHLSRSLPQRCFKRQGGSLSLKKRSIITRNTGRYTELRFEFRLGWQEKSATSMCLENPNWLLSSGSELSVVWAQRSWKGCGFSASVRFWVAPFWSSTRLQLTCWELWSHTLHGGTQTWSQ